MRTGLAVALAACMAAFGLVVHLAASGDSIALAYEGWSPNPDGSFQLFFGYYNRNLVPLDVTVGPNNHIEPGGPDQGQPTHFYPFRSRMVFGVRVPKDFGSRELVWTLTSHGQTERAYGTLHPDYIIDKGVIQSNNGAPIGAYLDNVAPKVEVEGAPMRQAKVGVPITLTAVAFDDGMPKPGPAYAGVIQVPTSAMGLRLSWLVYRGAGAVVTFDPRQFDAWEDYRLGGNSPNSPGWVPPPVPQDNRWVVRATFSEPGSYVLRALAHDGALATARDITVTVTR